MITRVVRKLPACKSLVAQKSLVVHGQTWLPKRTIFSRRIIENCQASSLIVRRFEIRSFTACNFVNLESKFSTCASPATEPSGIIEVPLAQTGEGIADCELLSWLVKEGDEIHEFQPLCSVQSDKATIQITSRYKGKVSRLNFLPGDVIKVGESLLELISDSSSAPSSSEDETLEKSDLCAKHDSDGDVGNHSRRILATPAVRQLARTHGINLENISGSGKDGRVLKEDVLKLLDVKEGLNEEMAMMSTIAPKEELVTSIAGDEQVGSSAEQVKEVLETSNHPQWNEKDTTIHVRGYHRTMVKAMTAAAAIPHFYLVDDVKLDALVTLRKNLQDSYTEQGVKLTYLPFMIKALSVALSKFPLMNSTYNEEASTICYRGTHNVGIAVATPHGLAVPNIKNVQRLSVIEIAKELARLTQLATANKLSAEDVSGGTISVSNFGSIGGKLGYPLLNLPEVAIGAFGRIQKIPCFAEDGSIYPASLMNVTWAADHRVLDGATLAKFFITWKALIEQPERLVVQLR